MFFLYRPKQILLYVSLFTRGHSLTLLAGAIGGWRFNPYPIDAIIGLSVVYKAFDSDRARDSQIGREERQTGPGPVRRTRRSFGLLQDITG